MASEIIVCLLVICFQILLVEAETNGQDLTAFTSFQDDWKNIPTNWVGSDPCGSSWVGIHCNNSRVTDITLASKGLTGRLSGGFEFLPELQRLDLSYNKGLTGPLPESIGTLKNLTHLMLGGCGFNGPIPYTIGSLQRLVMLSLNSNSFTGQIPPAIGNLTNLFWLDLTENKLSGSIPISDGTAPGLDMLVNAKHFHLGKNQLTGEIPSRLFSSKMTLIHLLIDSNKLHGSIPSTIGLVKTLLVLRLDGNFLSGHVPPNLNNLVLVSDLYLSNNKLTGSLPNLTGMSSLNYVDMSNNSFDSSIFPQWFSTLKSLTTLMMESTGLNGQIPVDLFSLPVLQTLVLKNNQLSGTLDLGSSYSNQLQRIDLQHNLIVNFTEEVRSNISLILVDNPICKEKGGTKTYCVIQQPRKTSHKSSSSGIIIGAVLGGSVLVLLSLLAGIYAFRQKRRAEIADKQNNPFASWDPSKRTGDIPQLKGPRSFSFEDLKKYTNNFSEANDIGSGGYGKVYRGALPTGQLVAVKRAQRVSMQGDLEFKTEIELLSRVHHKNVVSLLGFCFDQGEQMLVYEYIPNGSLKESLSGKTGIRLDWRRRLRIALGAARGLQYLHELANPPIIHRDIKSNNILLDERLNAKVSDFGLSKPIGDTEKGHLTTQVKGTMGYMDPEYYMTQQLTEKSDVYSFGVLLLEMVSARQPIEKGKYIVREVKQKMDKSKVGYNLQEIIDPTISGTTLGGLEKFVDVAMRCVEETGAERPTMGEVVKEINDIMQIVGLNPNDDLASTSVSHEGASKRYDHPYSDESLCVYSGVFTPSKSQ